MSSIEDICYVYVMHIEDMNLCKIGISKDPPSRLRQLSTGSPFKISSPLVLATPNTFCARMVESNFHRVMSKKRMNGEWFSLSANDAIVLMLGNVYCFFKDRFEFSDEEILDLLINMGMPDGYLEHLTRYPEAVERSAIQ